MSGGNGITQGADALGVNPRCVLHEARLADLEASAKSVKASIDDLRALVVKQHDESVSSVRELLTGPDGWRGTGASEVLRVFEKLASQAMRDGKDAFKSATGVVVAVCFLVPILAATGFVFRWGNLAVGSASAADTNEIHDSPVTP